jgi:glycosyltransferase involved in cell wall biosynthesis
MPALSIIVPVYNKVKYIDECLQSILRQTFIDFELILVNDGSTDGSGYKCKEYQHRDSRVIVIDQENAGVSAARNSGLKAAKGNYIGFVDCDDSVEAGMYETLISNIIGYDADISVCRLRVVNQGRQIPFKKRATILLNHDQASVANLKGELDKNVNNKIYKRELCKGIEFDGSLYEDILFTAKLFKKSKQTVLEQLVMYNYIIRDNSVSMKPFSAEYIQTIDVSEKIVSMMSGETAEVVEASHAFNFETNLSLLNLLLLQERGSYIVDLKRVIKTLHGYERFAQDTKILSAKHRYAYKTFRLSPGFYRSLMYLYCRITQSDVIKRTL